MYTHIHWYASIYWILFFFSIILLPYTIYGFRINRYQPSLAKKVLLYRKWMRRITRKKGRNTKRKWLSCTFPSIRFYCSGTLLTWCQAYRTCSMRDFSCGTIHIHVYGTEGMDIFIVCLLRGIFSALLTLTEIYGILFEDHSGESAEGRWNKKFPCPLILCLLLHACFHSTPRLVMIIDTMSCVYCYSLCRQ